MGAECQIIEVSELDLAREFILASTSFLRHDDTLTVFIADDFGWMQFSFEVGREVAKELIESL